MGTLRIRKSQEGKTRYQMIVRVYRNGRGFHKTKTFSTKREALDWEKKLIYQIDAGTVTQDSLKRRKVSDAIDKYIATTLPQKPKNRKHALQHLEWWRKAVGGFDLTQLTPAICAECRDKLLTEIGPKGKIRKPGTALRILATMSACLEVAVREWMWIVNNPFRSIKRPPQGKRRIRVFTLEEIKAIRQACAQSNNPYLLSIFTIALHSGMRRGEILSLRWSDINLKEREICLPTSKNGEPRTLHMTAEVHSIFSTLFTRSKVSDISGIIFSSPNIPTQPIDIRTAWKNALRIANVNGANFHTIRHTACTYLAQLGVNPSLIARIVGHRDTRTTDIYTHAQKGAVKEILEKLGSLVSEGI